MTDFTKKELQYLFESVENNCEEYREPDIAYVIKDKLEAMVANYCEHKELNSDCDHEFKLCRCFQGVDEYNYRCVKCLIIYEKINHDYKKVNVQ